MIINPYKPDFKNSLVPKIEKVGTENKSKNSTEKIKSPLVPLFQKGKTIDKKV